VPYLIIIALVLLWRHTQRKDFKVFIFSSILLTYFIFSLVAATKMPAYCYIVALPLTLSLGVLAWKFQKYSEIRFPRFSKAIFVAGLLILAFLSINLKGIAKLHSGYDPDNIYRINKVKFTEEF